MQQIVFKSGIFVILLSVLGIFRPLLNQKHNSGWFLLRKFVDLARVCSLHIITRKYSNTFLLIKLQKNKNLSKVKQFGIRSKGLLVLILGFWTGFCPLLNV